MKNITFFLILFCLSFSANCQVTKRDSITKAVEEYVQTVNKAAEVFLNRQLSTAERLKAIASYPIIYDERQVEQFKRTVLSNDEKPEIRAMALNKIYKQVENDDKLLNQIIEWFGNPATPKVLRDETLNLIGNLSYSSFVGVPDVYRKMIQDPDPKFRSFAISKLIMNGDARTQQLLISGLENPSSALVEPSLAIELLALSPKKDFYPVVYKILLESKDESARLTALQTLGPYREAREKIISISQDPKEKDDFRVSALMALYSGDKDNIIKYVTPILQDNNASVRLQSLGIQMSIDIRKSMAYRKSKKAKKADDYDQKIKDIAEGRGVIKSPELREIANKYILLVRPNF